MNKPLFLAIASLVVIAGAGLYLWSAQQAVGPSPTAPNEQMPNPEQPKDTLGHPLISVTSPTQNQLISSPLTITGQARGQWYFEATFSAELVDANGNLLAELPVMAEGDWMTEDFVPFSAMITFSTPQTNTGKLILRKANASGLPEHDDSVEIPVAF